MSEPDRPLVSFVLVAYNQERFVAEAIQGAFAQTYSPLEIILSDDCSTDRTFEVMKEEAARYAGPHSVVLNRNPRNLGICGHVNRVMELARGRWIVGAAGDDVSLPERVAIAAQEWIDGGCGELSIYTSYDVIDEAGRRLHSVMFPRRRLSGDAGNRIDIKVASPGASHSWSKALFERFGRIIDNAVNEDAILQFRASLRGGVLTLPDTSVRYRMHAMNISKIDSPTSLSVAPNKDRDKFISNSLRSHERYLRLLHNFEKDLLVELSLEPARAAELKPVLEKLRRKIRLLDARIQFFEGGWATRLRCMMRVASGRHGLVELTRMAMLWISPRAYEFVKEQIAKE